jgi:hypothetical protein
MAAVSRIAEFVLGTSGTTVEKVPPCACIEGVKGTTGKLGSDCTLFLVAMLFL